MFQYGNWLRLPLPTRQKIAHEFNIVKRGSTHVVDNRVQDDGYLVHEVEAALTPEAIQRFLNTGEADLEVLWGKLVDRIEGREEEAVPVVIVPNVVEVVAAEELKKGDPVKINNKGEAEKVVVKRKLGRPKNNTGK